MKMDITFPGGAGVDAHFRGFAVRTDQQVEAGGLASAPEPFDLFLASLGTCAGYYAVRFLQSRDLSIEGLKMTLEPIRDPQNRRLTTIRLDIELPDGFPERYAKAIVRAIEQCAVKKVIDDPPVFEVRAEIPEPAGSAVRGAEPEVRPTSPRVSRLPPKPDSSLQRSL